MEHTNYTKRAALILLDFLSGDSSSKLGKRYNLSRERICQILRKQLSKEDMEILTKEHHYRIKDKEFNCKYCGEPVKSKITNKFCNRNHYLKYRHDSKIDPETKREKERQRQKAYRENNKKAVKSRQKETV